MVYTFNFNQDEFRRWFLAKVRVLLAPGKNPFYSLETQTTSPSSSPTCSFSSTSPTLGNGQPFHSSDGSPAQELIKRYAEYQPIQVGTTRRYGLYLLNW